MSEKYKCPGCKQFKEATCFSARPIDQRCDVCLPVDQAMVSYDKKVQLAGQKWAAVVDTVGKATGLGPVERMLQTYYDEWGGENQFAHDLVACHKALIDNSKFHAAAQNMTAMLKLHAKIDRDRMEDNWRQMDDDSVDQNLKKKMAALMAKMETDKLKRDTIDGLLENAPAVTDS